jgi:SAM-dependent methyltransferase
VTGGDVSGFYDHDLAVVHSSGFVDLSLAGGALVLEELRRSGLAGGLLVDLGCGAGEWAGLASAGGLEVIGVDVSADMIELARSQAPRARFVTASLWDFELPSPVSAVTAFGEALSYGTPGLPSPEDLAALFDRVARSLVPGGVFAFDVLVSGEPMRYRSWTDEADYTVLVDVDEDPPSASLSRRIIVFSRRQGEYRRSDELHVLRVYDTQEIGRALSAAGMSYAASGSYSGFALGPRRAAFVARPS